jgi:hypothetical protein
MIDSTNLDAAIAAVHAESGTPVRRDDLGEYVAKINELATAVKDLRLPHARAIASAADKASRDKKAKRIKLALELLAEHEAAEGVAA